MSSPAPEAAELGIPWYRYAGARFAEQDKQLPSAHPPENCTGERESEADFNKAGL